jgi:membrane protease YdiL (CAAX protease family)
VQSPPEDEPGSGPGDWKILSVPLDSEPPAAIPTEEDRLPDAAWVPGPPPGEPPSGPPGGRIFSLEGRPAAGLYLVAWLFALGGIALLFVGTQTQDASARGFLGVGFLLSLLIAFAAGAGYQVVSRSGRPRHLYRGPSPIVLFVLLTVSVLTASVLLSVIGVEGSTRVLSGFLAGLGVQVAGYVVIVWLFVVQTGALSWAEMGWPRRSSYGNALNAIGLAVATMLPATFAVLIFGAIVATLLGGVEAPSVLPNPQSQLDSIAIVVAAAVVVPIGEELFFRGFALAAWLRDLGPRSALIRSAVFFGAVHVLNIQSATFDVGARQAVLVLAEILPLGFLLGWLFLQRGMLASIAGHATYNGVLLLLLALGSGSRPGG